MRLSQSTVRFHPAKLAHHYPSPASSTTCAVGLGRRGAGIEPTADAGRQAARSLRLEDEWFTFAGRLREWLTGVSRWWTTLSRSMHAADAAKSSPSWQGATASAPRLPNSQDGVSFPYRDQARPFDLNSENVLEAVARRTWSRSSGKCRSRIGRALRASSSVPGDTVGERQVHTGALARCARLQVTLVPFDTI
jgi:hypothetical protein